MITLDQVTASYDARTAIRDVSFDVQEGETLGVLGPNGAGKTTLIHVLLGIRSPDSGTIETRWNTDPGDEAHRARFGVVPQDPCLYDHLTGRENLMFFGQMYDLSGTRLHDRVEQGLSMVGLSDRASDPVHTYSNGMKRRLSFAGALTHEPGVLLLDEPSAGVDPQSRNPLFECFETLQQQDRTILYLTHDVQQAQKRCDRVGILDRGRLLALDRVDRLIEDHGGQPVVRMTLVELPERTDDLPGVLNGSELRVQTDEPGQMISRLQERGLEFTECQVKQPNLTSVFMNLTGRDLRDDQDH